MSTIQLPSRNVATYLAAAGASPVVLTDKPRVVAVSIPQLRRWQGCIEWVAWARSAADAAKVATPDLVWHQRPDGVKALRSVPEIVDAVEQRARDVAVVLTPHERALQRAAQLGQHLDEILRTMQASGALRSFNLSYKLHRARMNGRVMPFAM